MFCSFDARLVPPLEATALLVNDQHTLTREDAALGVGVVNHFAALGAVRDRPYRWLSSTTALCLYACHCKTLQIQTTVAAVVSR